MTGNLLNLSELYTVINEQCKVAADGRILAQVLELNLILLDGFDDSGPVDLCIEHFLVNAHLMRNLVAELTIFGQCLAIAQFQRKAVSKEVVLGLAFHHKTSGHASAAENVLNISLQLIE